MNLLPPVLLSYVEGLKTHDLARIADTLAEDVEIVLALRTLKKQSFLNYLTTLYAAFPDWRYQHGEAEIAASGVVSIKWRQGGTHTQPWTMPGSTPIPPTGKAIRIPEQLFTYEISGDKIREIRPEQIQGGVPQAILDQIGATDPLP